MCKLLFNLLHVLMMMIDIPYNAIHYIGLDIRYRNHTRRRKRTAEHRVEDWGATSQDKPVAVNLLSVWPDQ